MDVIQIRLPEKEVAEIDRRVKKGEYPSRSEAIREMVRRAELFEAMTSFMGLVKEEGISSKEIDKIVREEAYKEMFGN